MKIQDKMKRDWDRRASVDAHYWVAATQEADLESYEASALNDTQALISGLKPHLPSLESEGKGRAVLDLGCGIGRMTALLTPHFEQVVGVDVSEVMIERARELHSSEDTKIDSKLSFEVNSGSDLGAFQDCAFDVVCSYSVLAHLPADVVAAYFCEVGRVLEQGGVFRYQFWVSPTPEGALHPSDDNSLNIHVYDEAHLATLHERAGLEEVGREEIDYLDPVLNLKPLWITARKVGEAHQSEALEREVGEGLTDEELRMEYELMLYLSVKHIERGELALAEPILERATHLAPQWPEAYMQWVEVRLQQDDLNGVQLLLSELLKHTPEHVQARLFLAQLALTAEEFNEAHAYLSPLTDLLAHTPADFSEEEVAELEEARQLYLSLMMEAEAGRLAAKRRPQAKASASRKGRGGRTRR